MKLARRCVVLLAFGGLFGHCQMFFWRPAEPAQVAVWYESNRSGVLRDRFVALTTSYQEKNSFDPLAGTTDKRGYRTGLRLLDVVAAGDGAKISEGPQESRWPEFPGWILETSVFRAGPGGGLWFIGGENNQYGGSERVLYLASADGRSRVVQLEGAKGLQLERAVPSPAGNLLAVLEEPIPGSADSLNSRLRIFSVDLRTAALTKISQTILPAPFAAGPRWAADNTRVYIKNVSSQAMSLAAEAGAEAKSAARYPACFSPATTSGGGVSDHGYRLHFDESSGAFVISRETEHVAFDAAPEIVPGISFACD